MSRRARISSLGLALVIMAGPASAATDNGTLPLASDRAAINVDRSPDPVKQPVTLSNPLWGIPLATLSATRERPLFTPSRRPPAPPVVAAPRLPPPPRLAAPPPEPEHLRLVLIGTVIGSAEGIGIFLDQPTQRMIRLRLGEQHSGWVLRAVRAREVTLEKGQRVEILSLPRPGAPAPNRERQL